MFIIHNAVVAGEIFLGDGAILINDGKIAAIDESRKIIEDNLNVERVDAGGRLLLPGLVNAHHHLYSFLAPGITPHGVAGTFTQILENLWWPLDDVLDEESVYYSALMGALDAVAHGSTTIFDHHASMSFVNGSLDVVKSAFEKAGARGVLCFETSERGGKDKIHSHIEENISFYENNKNNSFFSGMFGLHANMTLGDETLSTIKKNLPTKMPVHVHCGESFEDFAFCQNLGYAGAVDRLDKFGLISESAILAHCVHVSARDVEIIGDKKPFVVTNSESNANNTVGTFNRAVLPRHLLGTDGMSGDIIAALRSYYLLGMGSREPFERIAKVFFGTQRELLKRFFPRCEGLKVGADADICVLDYAPISPIDSNNALGHILFGAKGGKAWMTVVNGKILWRGGEFKNGIEYEKILRAAKQAAKNLHKRFYTRGRYEAKCFLEDYSTCSHS